MFGLRRIGKTLLLKEFIRRTLVEDKEAVPAWAGANIGILTPGL